MGRWDPRPRAMDYDPDEYPDVDEDPPAVHYAQRIAALELELASKACADERRRRAEQDLASWQKLLEAEQRDAHWQAGEGDRTLF